MTCCWDGEQRSHGLDLQKPAIPTCCWDGEQRSHDLNLQKPAMPPCCRDGKQRSHDLNLQKPAMPICCWDGEQRYITWSEPPEACRACYIFRRILQHALGTFWNTARNEELNNFIRGKDLQPVSWRRVTYCCVMAVRRTSVHPAGREARKRAAH
ncbi:hypothetical protein BDL97_02G149400 [Sphagnum fallax]|nr:hypothetical protein BDL97_02G149400 [Sphagnum fallax]